MMAAKRVRRLTFAVRTGKAAGSGLRFVSISAFLIACSLIKDRVIDTLAPCLLGTSEGKCVTAKR